LVTKTCHRFGVDCSQCYQACWLSTVDSYKGMASVTIGDGSSCLFWSVWHGAPLSAQWPHLFSFAKEDHILVQQLMAAEDKSVFFHVPLLVEAHDQYQLLISELEDIHLTQSKDTWGYIWGSSIFASSKAYKQLLGSIPVPPIYNGCGSKLSTKEEGVLLISH